jgi:hypothetical protein
MSAVFETSTLTDDAWRLVIKTIKIGECVPFIGAGASMGVNVSGVPTGSELARKIADECNYHGAERDDFLRVCQFCELTDGPHLLRKCIVENLNEARSTPSAVHMTLAELPVTHVLTTNFDSLMERAFKTAQKKPNVVIHDFRSKRAVNVPQGSKDEPVVFKLHGSVDQPSSMVCTEDDVVQFLAGLIHEQPPLPASIRQLFESRSFLFIGYGLRDWNIRVMIRTLRWNNPQPDWIRSFAIQRRPPDKRLAVDFDNMVIYWNRKEGILCFDADAGTFSTQLKEKLTLYS